MTLIKLAPSPPRLDRWPVAVQSAELLRGTVTRCGPGLRLISWPETPLVRAAAIAGLLERERVALHLTAAWVWGASRHPGTPLSFAVTTGHRNASAPSGIALHQYRLATAEVAHLGDYAVTTPVRTVYDLLRHERFGRRERLACRLLLAAGADTRRAVIEAVKRRPRPFDARVRGRLDAL